MDVAAVLGMLLFVGFALLLFVLFFVIGLGGFFIVQPRTQVVVLRFGKFVETINTEGIKWGFPIGRKLYRLSSQVTSLELPRMMVLEAEGNPIEVAAMVSYRIRDAYKAALEVQDARTMVSLLATAVVKNVCSQFPYATQNHEAPCLRKESEVVTRALMSELQELLVPAGVEVLQVRLNDLAYAPEIAQSMLLRQQASAMVDARRTIVDGAVWTMTHAQKQMAELVIRLGPDATELFASNLMLVLCSGERVQTMMPLVAPAVKDGGVR